MRHIKPLPPIEVLNELLSYDKNSGVFRWKKDRGGGAAKGDEAGTLCPDGYIRITINGKQYAANRLAWKMATGEDPKGVVDHRDHETSNNRFSNLRDTTQARNVQNTSRRNDNKTGFKGVVFTPRIGRFQINLKVNGRRINLPSFATAEEAHRAAVIARNEAHGEFAFHRRVDSERATTAKRAVKEST